MIRIVLITQFVNNGVLANVPSHLFSHTQVRPSGESLRIMWPSCGLKLANPDVDTNQNCLKIVVIVGRLCVSTDILKTVASYILKCNSRYALSDY